jgi:alpha-tubulin suppressor-like RCC1 family protein
MKIKKVKSGKDHTLVLTGILFPYKKKGDNHVYGYGSNKYGQLGIGDAFETTKIPEKIDYFDEKNIIDIFVGFTHSFCLSGIFYFL